MREIKFRAWDKLNKKMEVENFYPPSFANSDGSFGYENGNGYNIMQYTGLKDKNGKEIYEGDIIYAEYAYDGRRSKQLVGPLPAIEFDGGIFGIYWKGWDGFRAIRDFIENIEIIGNIYDNPELLK